MKIYLQKSSKTGKKWKVTIEGKQGRTKTVHFGASGYQDYTQHKDKERKERYLARHKSRENWGKSGIRTAGFWSRWLLWNKPTISGSLTDIRKRFKVQIKRGAPP